LQPIGASNTSMIADGEPALSSASAAKELPKIGKKSDNVADGEEDKPVVDDQITTAGSKLPPIETT